MIPREAYRAIENIVGPENVSNDPAICLAYRRGGWFLELHNTTVPPDCIVLPGRTEEVRDIVRICNRYKIPFVPVGTCATGFASFPTRHGFIAIDCVRMKNLIIDEKNMFAIVEPGVTYGELQAEAFKKGLWYITIGAGSQTRVLSNTHFLSVGPLGYRMGPCGVRRELAYEWVTPTGEIINIGSSALSGEYFWGDGPGPDLKGLLRDHFSLCGGLGIITKMAVKLFPFIPPSEARLEPGGITPTTYLQLPTHRIKWYNIRFPTYEKMIDAIYEICKAEIGTIVYTVPPMFLFHTTTGRAGSRTEIRDKFEKDREKFRKEGFWMLRVLLVGYVSEKQLLYEEKVLKEIAMEYGATSIKEGSPRDHSWIVSMDAYTVYNVAGVYNAIGFAFDSIRTTAKALKALGDIRDKYVPYLYDSVDYGWMHYYDFGHTSYGEFCCYFDLENAQKFLECLNECIKRLVEMKVYVPRVPVTTPMLGPLYGNYHMMLKKLKEEFDPNNVSNPPKPLSHEG